MIKNSNPKVWLIGAGNMALDYSKVLNALDIDYDVIGRGEKSANIFFEKSGKTSFKGGLVNFLDTNPKLCNFAIIAVNIDQLYDTTKNLLNYGVKNILVEKPGGVNFFELNDLSDIASSLDANIYIAYNRRFYASVIKLKEIIENGFGVQSFNFEFTEWAHIIEPASFNDKIKQSWLLSNSSHVIDLAFYLGGAPEKLTTYHSGKLKWHQSGSIFTGSGISKLGALFSYQANWESAGRWGLEIHTDSSRYILCPMEKLRIQKNGELAIKDVENIDYKIDEVYKPGLYRQVECFLKEKYENMIDIHHQVLMMEIYYKMANYK